MKVLKFLASLSLASMGFMTTPALAGPAIEYTTVIENIDESSFPLLSAEVRIEESHDAKRFEDKVVPYTIHIIDFYRVRPDGKRVFLKSFPHTEWATTMLEWKQSLKFPNRDLISAARSVATTKVEKVIVPYRHKRLLSAEDSLRMLEKSQSLLNEVLNVCEGVKLDLGKKGGVLNLQLGGNFQGMGLVDKNPISCIGDCPPMPMIIEKAAVVKFKCEKAVYSVDQ